MGNLGLDCRKPEGNWEPGMGGHQVRGCCVGNGSRVDVPICQGCDVRQALLDTPQVAGAVGKLLEHVRALGTAPQLVAMAEAELAGEVIVRPVVALNIKIGPGQGDWLELGEGTFAIRRVTESPVAVARAELAGERVIETWHRGDDKVCIDIDGEEPGDLSLTTVHAMLNGNSFGSGRRYAIRPLSDPPAPKPEKRRVHTLETIESEWVMCPGCQIKVRLTDMPDVLLDVYAHDDACPHRENVEWLDPIPMPDCEVRDE